VRRHPSLRVAASGSDGASSNEETSSFSSTLHAHSCSDKRQSSQRSNSIASLSLPDRTEPGSSRGCQVTGFERAVDDLVHEYRDLRASMHEADRHQSILRREAAHSAVTAQVARERATAIKAYLNRQKKEVAKMTERLTKAIAQHKEQQEHDKASYAGAVSSADEALAKAQAEAMQTRLRLQHQEQATAKVHAMRESTSLRIQRTRTISKALDQSISSVLGTINDPAIQWPKLLSEVVHTMIDALETFQTSPTSQAMRKSPSGGPSVMDAAGRIMAERIAETAAGVGHAVASTKRTRELKDALAQEQAKGENYRQAIHDTKMKSEQLVAELLRVRRQRQEVEVEQSEFVPFAAKEMEDAIGHIAKLRQAPEKTRKLAAVAKSRLQKLRRSSSETRHGHCCCCRRAPSASVPWL